MINLVQLFAIKRLIRGVTKHDFRKSILQNHLSSPASSKDTDWILCYKKFIIIRAAESIFFFLRKDEHLKTVLFINYIIDHLKFNYIYLETFLSFFLRERKSPFL